MTHAVREKTPLATRPVAASKGISSRNWAQLVLANITGVGDQTHFAGAH